MSLDQINEIAPSRWHPLAEDPDAEMEEPPRQHRSANSRGFAADHYPRLLDKVFSALRDPEGYDAGLRRLDDELRQRGPSQFARFYIEEMLGRSPATAAEARELVLCPSRRISEILSSNEFMGRHDIILQREFPHLSREFFFHIPKSGGSTLTAALDSDGRFCPIDISQGRDSGAFAYRLASLRNTILRLANPRTRSVLIIGHPSVKRILSYQLKRGWDHAFTILRDPIDSSLSMINYVLTRLCDYPTAQDSATWRDILQLPDDPFLPDRRRALELAPKIVELLVPDNPTCGALGTEPLLESVLDNAVILDLKIIRFQQIDDYIRYRGVARHKRFNISTRYVELSDLDRRLRLTIYDKNAEDLKFYDWVGRHMIPGDGPWFEL
ncbi:MAG TPA: hypothetical protein VMF05_01415 [Stellaceae bacterium]|nr:hypothetical protein [Stellaceae bacterium]